LLLDEFFDFITQSGQAFTLLVTEAFQVKNVGLVLVGVFVNFGGGVLAKSFTLVQEFNDVTEDSFVLTLLLIEWFGGTSDDSDNTGGFLQVADVEENSGVFEGLFEFLGNWDHDFVDFN
jgi:hypothetical protein